jgi:hypothetical protein
MGDAGPTGLTCVATAGIGLDTHMLLVAEGVSGVGDSAEWSVADAGVNVAESISSGDDVKELMRP